MDENARVLVIVPTYNEAENITAIVTGLRALGDHIDVLIADDNSPDGTGTIADDLAAADGHIHVMHRAGKEGLGAAYLAGFGWGLKCGYDVLCECDADGSHQPKHLPSMLEALESADMVKGSRWVSGGGVVNWPWHRIVLSKGGSWWTRLWLGIPVKDVTGGYSAFRADTLRGIDLTNIESAGYCFQIDLVWRTLKAGFKVREVPITFVEREFGQSKMSKSIVIEAITRTTKWGIAYRLAQLRRLLPGKKS